MIVSIFNEYIHMDLSQISHANSDSYYLDVTAQLLFCYMLDIDCIFLSYFVLLPE